MGAWAETVRAVHVFRPDLMRCRATKRAACGVTMPSVVGPSVYEDKDRLVNVTGQCICLSPIR